MADTMGMVSTFDDVDLARRASADGSVTVKGLCRGYRRFGKKGEVYTYS